MGSGFASPVFAVNRTGSRLTKGEEGGSRVVDLLLEEEEGEDGVVGGETGLSSASEHSMLSGPSSRTSSREGGGIINVRGGGSGNSSVNVSDSSSGASLGAGLGLGFDPNNSSSSVNLGADAGGGGDATPVRPRLTSFRSRSKSESSDHEPQPAVLDPYNQIGSTFFHRVVTESSAPGYDDAEAESSRSFLQLLRLRRRYMEMSKQTVPPHLASVVGEIKRIRRTTLVGDGNGGGASSGGNGSGSSPSTPLRSRARSGSVTSSGDGRVRRFVFEDNFAVEDAIGIHTVARVEPNIRVLRYLASRVSSFLPLAPSFMLQH
jgi:hypothetical protein